MTENIDQEQNSVIPQTRVSQEYGEDRNPENQLSESPIITEEFDKSDAEKIGVEIISEELPEIIVEKEEVSFEDVEPATKLKAIAATDDDDFDWDEDSGYSTEERTKLEKLYEGTLSSVEENTIIKGTIVAIGVKEVVVNVGFKSEGVVPVSEFRDLPDLKIGDQIDVYLETVEDTNGQMTLSRKRAQHIRTWDMVMDAERNDVILEGVIKRRTKGGFVCDIQGIEAFLPGSQIDVKPVRDFDAFVGKKMDFKVVKVNQQFDNVVVSHKILIEKDLEKQRQEILKNLEKGQVLEGTVKNMTNFGVFIDLGGVDGLLHITDISWGRINDPREMLDLDQKLNIVVLDFDEEKKRISLGLKQLQPHPWDSLSAEIVSGTRVKGTVVTVADYGIFVEVSQGVEGLVHLSEMSWSQHLKDPSELYRIGDPVEAVVISIDREERKMSLGLKQIKEDPWTKVAEKYPVGSRHTGTVRGMTNYGMFVELEEGVDGLVHISDLSWTKKFSHPDEFTTVNSKIEIIVLDLDVENRRLSLGHKQLTEDVWDTFETIFQEGSEHEGSLLKINDKGATVELEYGIEGFAPIKHLAKEDNKGKFKPGDKVKVKVIEFNKDAKRLVLSHTHTWNLELQEEKSQGKTKTSSSSRPPKPETTTLGELESLQGLKQQMMENEEKAAAGAMEKKASKKEAKSEPVAEVLVETPVVEEVAGVTEPEIKAEPKKKAAPKKKAVPKAKAPAESPVKGEGGKKTKKVAKKPAAKKKKAE